MCAIDFSALSRRALRYAAAVAARAQGTLSVLFVNDPLLVAAAGATELRLDVPAQSARELDRFIRSVLGKAASLQVARRVATGGPAEEILMLRDRDRWFHPGRGALTCRIFSQANVPVLACPPRWRLR